MKTMQLTKQTMNSREIAELSGKMHKHVLDAIRTMEPAWDKVSGTKFRLAEYTDEQGKKRPMYELTKTECLYIATKFNDEQRAKLVLRWEELETQNIASKAIPQRGAYKEGAVFVSRMGDTLTQSVYKNGEIYTKFSPLLKYLGYSNSSCGSYIKRLDAYCIKVEAGSQEAWFVNAAGLDEVLRTTTLPISYDRVSRIYRDVFGIENHPKDGNNPYTHQFTDAQMLALIKEIHVSCKPTAQKRIIDKLMEGAV